MKILAVSDVVIDWIYSPRIRFLLPDIDLVIGCGDLPPYYFEYIVSALDKPILQVHGNHSIDPRFIKEDDMGDNGSTDLHGRVIRYGEYTFAGIEGSLLYNKGMYQYSQLSMWLKVIKITPVLLLNKIKYGRPLNVMVTHAPPWGIHDQQDLAHQGIKAFRWVITTFQPDYLVHGHIHIYRPDAEIETRVGKTTVVNAYGWRYLELPHKG